MQGMVKDLLWISKNGWDYLNFFIDEQHLWGWSGEFDWRQENFLLQPGIRQIQWIYMKDLEIDYGEDCGWIDNVFITGVPLTSKIYC